MSEEEKAGSSAKALDNGCYKKMLIKHERAGMMAAEAEKRARADCMDDGDAEEAAEAADKALSIGGCVGSAIDRHIANGIPVNRAYMLAEEECIGARKEAAATAASADEDGVFERILQRIKSALGRDDPQAETSFKVVGNHFLAVWSNNFKDRDGEIFPQKAIDAYVARVDAGVVKPPELWVWHVGKAVSVGQADWVATRGHFTVAAGEFSDTPAAQAARDFYAQSKNAKDTSVSHGFVFPADQFDGKHYHEFNTFEISLLPRGAEANLYTSLEGVKDMAVTQQKREYLEKVFGKEHAERILANLDERGKALEALGIEFKDFTDVDLTASADKEAASKAFELLAPDLIEGSAESVTAALEAVKAVKAAMARIDEQDGVIADLKAKLDQRPRSASLDARTLLDPEKHKELYDKMQAGNTHLDEFWRTPVKGGS